MLYVRRGAVAALIGVAVAFGGFSAAVSANATGGRPVSAAVRARLRSIILNAARRNGDSHPRNLRMVETTSTAVGAGGLGQAPFPVYDLAASGHFVANDASPPPGARAPTGIGLWMVVERNGSLLGPVGWGVDRFYVNLRKFGKVQSL